MAKQHILTGFHEDPQLPSYLMNIRISYLLVIWIRPVDLLVDVTDHAGNERVVVGYFLHFPHCFLEMIGCAFGGQPQLGGDGFDEFDSHGLDWFRFRIQDGEKWRWPRLGTKRILGWGFVDEVRDSRILMNVDALRFRAWFLRARN